MFWTMARLHWVFRTAAYAPGPSWAYFSPGVRRDYEPLWIPEWHRLRPFRIAEGK